MTKKDIFNKMDTYDEFAELQPYQIDYINNMDKSTIPGYFPREKGKSYAKNY